MFAKKHRLAKTKDVQSTFGRGRSFFNSVITVKYAKSVKPQARFTVVVSTKVSKKAVVRNRLKRIIRNLLKERIPALVIGDYVVILKPKAIKIPEKELLDQLSLLLGYARLLPKTH